MDRMRPPRVASCKLRGRSRMDRHSPCGRTADRLGPVRRPVRCPTKTSAARLWVDPDLLALNADFERIGAGRKTATRPAWIFWVSDNARSRKTGLDQFVPTRTGSGLLAESANRRVQRSDRNPNCLVADGRNCKFNRTPGNPTGSDPGAGAITRRTPMTSERMLTR